MWYLARTLLRSRGFTLLAVVTLAVGLGASVALFSVLDTVLWRPLPYGQSDRLVKIDEAWPRVPKGRVSWANYADWTAQAHRFDAIGAYRAGDYNLTGAGDPEQVQGAAVSAALFTLLRAAPQLGRAFSPDDDKPGAHQVVILSDGLWQRRFGADRSAAGKTLRIDGAPFEVIGIMPPAFFFPDPNVELWTPLAINPNSRMAGRSMHILDAIGRLRPGATVEQARAEMQAIAARLAAAYPRDNTGHTAAVSGLLNDWTGAYRTNLKLIFAAVVLVLLIACANVATLLLSRAARRRREIAIRRALGAGRGRIAGQLLGESLALAVLGVVAGLPLAHWLIRAIVLLTPGGIARIGDSGLSFPVLLFAFAAAAASGILLGIVPALHISKFETPEALNATSRGATASAGSGRLRDAFVVAEVSLAAMLLAGAGLLLKSYLLVERVDPGFNPANVLTASISLQNFRLPQRQAFVDRVLDRIRFEPGIVAAGAVTHLPLAGAGPSFDFQVAGRPPAAPGEESKAQIRCATPDYFRALGIALVAGRALTAADTASAPEVLVVNDAMARRYWPGESPIGRKITFDQGSDGAPVWREIVGVVRGVRHSSLESDPEPQMFAPFSQFSMPFATLAVRTSGDPLAFSRTLRLAVQSVNPDEPVSAVRSMQEVVDRSIASRRFDVLLLAFFAAIATLVASTGVYGVLSYSVSQRREEIGIRMALGSGTREVLWLVIKHGLRLAISGVCLGALGAWAVMRLLSTLLYQVTAADPAVFAVIAVLLVAVSALASCLPAWRATGVDPAAALR